MKRYLGYLFTGHGFALKSLAVYKVDFGISVLAAALHDGATLLFLTAIFANLRELQGWTFSEMVFIWGFAVVMRNLPATVFDIYSYTPGSIRMGTMDRVFVRPQPMLLQLATEAGLNVFAIGRVLVGAAAMITVLPSLSLPWWAGLYFPVALGGGILLMLGLNLLSVCFSFWFVNAQVIMSAVTWSSQFGQYPMAIFAWPLQFLFTWIMPYALAGFFPAAFLLRGEEYLFWGLIQPVWGVVFLAAGLLTWKVGLTKYQSTGS